MSMVSYARWATLAVSLLLGCAATTPEPKPVAPTVPRAPIDTSSLSGKELAEQLLPRHRSASRLLEPITDTSFLERYEGTPPGRLAEGPEGYERDLKFQAQVANLVDSQVIGPTTLVIDDTGHSIPNLARMLQEPSLGVVGTVHLHWNEHQAPRLRPGQSLERALRLMDASLGTLADQSQTFGDLIEKQQRDAARRMVTVLYVALDGLRLLDLRTGGWPTAQEFMIFGMTRAVVLIEKAKLWDYGTAEVAPDLLPWVHALRKGGLPVQVAGLDGR